MSKNMELFERAKKVMPGGGSSGGRTHQILKYPLYMDHTEGCRMYTVDGEEYMDFCCGSGATLYGHNHPRLKKAVEEAVKKGFFMGYESEVSVELAERIHQLIPGLEKIRFCNSGTEATMGAIRLARGFTGKNLIIKMDGHFHGMHEMVWYGHGNFPPMDEYGEVEAAIPDSAGFPAGADKNVRVIRFNDSQALEHALKKYRGDIAAVIMEPISYNCGCYEAKKEYLEKARELCTKENVLLIFDEVISGFRIRPGSAQEYYQVRPDLSTFAKAAGGGFQVALIGGRADIMDYFNPLGPVVMSGTYTGTYVAMCAGLECVKMISEPGFYDKLETVEKQLYDGINQLFKKYEILGHVRGKGGQFGIYFGYDDAEIDYDLRKSIALYNVEMGKKFIQGALDEHMFFHYFGGNVPYPAHCGISIQHTSEDIEEALIRMDRVFEKLKKNEIVLKNQEVKVL